MPTIITHAAPALALGLALGSKRVPLRLLAAGTLCAMAPDLDSIGYFLGVPYDSPFGHRGLSHSLALAGLAGLLGFCAAGPLKAKRSIAAFFLCAAVVSHIALDAVTSGGLGVACFWPVDDGRYFAPWRPIRVSPMSPRVFISARGLAVIMSELKWVWLPSLALAASGIGLRSVCTRLKSGKSAGKGVSRA